LTRRRVEILGCAFDALDMDETVRCCEELLLAPGTRRHLAINVAKLIDFRDHEPMQETIRRCDIVSADGQPLVWASRLLGTPLPERVTGIDLMNRLFALAARRGYSVFILGARDEVLARAVAELGRRHPDLLVCGYRNGYFSDEDSASVCAEVRAARPDLLFYAMTAPRGECWVTEHLDALGVPFVMGVGGAIDVVSGLTRRAPLWMQRVGLEWVYRLLQEPRRLAGRYARTNTLFVILLARELLTQRARRRTEALN
jgi:N-acetylglucosaminyldiphosphoundecaprenol N-acetyl-beta-D-mannosaminyltransferase